MVRDQTVAELYALRDCIMFGNSAFATYLSSSSNPALQDSTDAALMWLRDELAKRYPVPPTIQTVYVDRPVDRIVYVDRPVEQPLLSTEAKVSDQQVLTVPVLSAVGVSLGTKAKLTVVSSVVTGIKLV